VQAGGGYVPDGIQFEAINFAVHEVDYAPQIA